MCLSGFVLFVCFSVLWALRLPRLGKRELILVLIVCLFDCVCLVCLFSLPLGVWEGLRFVIVASLDFFSYLFRYMWTATSRQGSASKHSEQILYSPFDESLNDTRTYFIGVHISCTFPPCFTGLDICTYWCMPKMTNISVLFGLLGYLHLFMHTEMLNISVLFLPTWLFARHYKNTPVQIYWEFYDQKMKTFRWKFIIFFFYFCSKIDCGYSLEPPRRGGSNEYPQSMFWAEIRKNNIYPCKPSFTI